MKAKLIAWAVTHLARLYLLAQDADLYRALIYGGLTRQDIGLAVYGQWRRERDWGLPYWFRHTAWHMRRHAAEIDLSEQVWTCYKALQIWGRDGVEIATCVKALQEFEIRYIQGGYYANRPAISDNSKEAKLFAAAPEMYRAMVNLIMWARLDMIELQREGHTVRHLERAVDAAQKVITGIKEARP